VANGRSAINGMPASTSKDSTLADSTPAANSPGVLASVARLPRRIHTPGGTLRIAWLSELKTEPVWLNAFSRVRKDRRFYTIVEETIRQEFEYAYFVIENERGEPLAVQPFFILDQDLVAGSPPGIQNTLATIRKVWPRFLKARTLMVGCTAGEGHLDQTDEEQGRRIAGVLREGLLTYARLTRSAMLVLKEFPQQYRRQLASLTSAGYARIPSMPMTRLNIDYKDFEHYLNTALSKNTRKNLRRKFRDAEAGGPIELTILDDITPIADELLPLYMQVYDRSPLHFEKLTREFLGRLGKEMPGKAKFFVWRKQGRAIAFSILLLHDGGIYDEYIGMDYSVALDLHLYFTTFRDIVSWGIANGYKQYISTALNYDPKLHLKSELMPLDLYVRHTNNLINAIFKRILPWLEPTRSEKTLKKFPNYSMLWGDQ
jgi:hypothetical protein